MEWDAFICVNLKISFKTVNLNVLDRNGHGQRLDSRQLPPPHLISSMSQHKPFDMMEIIICSSGKNCKNVDLQFSNDPQDLQHTLDSLK